MLLQGAVLLFNDFAAKQTGGPSMAFLAYPIAKQTCLCDVHQLAMNLKQLAMQMM